MLIMKFQINCLVLIRIIREHNFKSFVKILISLVKWFFIFDHYNYVRWPSVHIQDHMPEIYQEFERGNFVFQISGRQFSHIDYDQAHEQSNKKIKYIKGPNDFVNCASDELQSKWEVVVPKTVKFLR